MLDGVSRQEPLLQPGGQGQGATPALAWLSGHGGGGELELALGELGLEEERRVEGGGRVQAGQHILGEAAPRWNQWPETFRSRLQLDLSRFGLHEGW